MLPDQTQLSDIARRCFRNTADEDYIAARSCYRMGLVEPYLWSSQQAVEKYLKAILLFNGVSARYANPAQRKNPFLHDLKKLVRAVRRLNDLDVQFPKWADDYIDYLNELGTNRYLVKSTFTFGRELQHLDETVWCIRRYCQRFNDRRGEHLTKKWIEHVHSERYRAHPQQFGLIGGELEMVLKRQSTDPARAALIWKNMYFGKVPRYRVSFRPVRRAINSPVKVTPDTPEYEELSRFVKL